MDESFPFGRTRGGHEISWPLFSLRLRSLVDGGAGEVGEGADWSGDQAEDQCADSGALWARGCEKASEPRVLLSGRATGGRGTDNCAHAGADTQANQRRAAAVGNLDAEDGRALEDEVLAVGAGERVGVDALELAAGVALACLHVDGLPRRQRLDVLPVGAGGR